jgi:hypothetical protein
MKMTQLAVMPLQALVNFFAPPQPANCTPNATKNIAARADIYWAKRQLGHIKQNLSATPNTHAMPAQGGLTQAAKHRVTQVSRTRATGLVIQASAAAPPQFIRMRRAGDGRMVISGRMRDVCAELNRMAV